MEKPDFDWIARKVVYGVLLTAFTYEHGPRKTVETLAATLRKAHDDALEEAAKVADLATTELNRYSERAKSEGRINDMYRANTAWHQTTAVATSIRALKDTPATKEDGNG